MPFGLKSTPKPQLLNKQQQEVIARFKKLEKKGHAAWKSQGLDRILELYVKVKYPHLSDKQMEKRAELIYQACKHVLRSAPLTTNISSTLFLNEGFYQSDFLETVWTTPTKKGFNYFNTRHKVEEGVFGYTIDWSVPIWVAARTRPVYAGLNYSRHPYGAAVAYGSISLFWKTPVRERCTFLSTDTFDAKFNLTGGDETHAAAARAQITTDSRIGNLCATLSNNQLKALCQLAENAYTLTADPPNYIEAHMHGTVRFDRDLESIHIASTGTSTYTKELAAVKRDKNAFLLLITQWAQRHRVRCSIWQLNQEVQVLNA